MISCQVCWRTTRWHYGRTRRSQNPKPEEVFRDCVTKWDQSAAHSILARSFHSNKGRIHLRRPTRQSHFSLATRRRTIHSGWTVIRQRSAKRRAHNKCLALFSLRAHIPEGHFTRLIMLQTEPSRWAHNVVHAIGRAATPSDPNIKLHSQNGSRKDEQR